MAVSQENFVFDSKKILIFGAGVMGSNLAALYALNGFEVELSDIETVDQKTGEKRNNAEKGRETAAAALKDMSEKGYVPEMMVNEAISKLKSSLITESFEEKAKADLIIEAVSENIEIKKNLYGNIIGKIFADAKEALPIIATNTSSFSVSELAEFAPNPERFLGMHYFYHAAKNRLVEIVPGEKTSGEVLKQMMRF